MAHCADARAAQQMNGEEDGPPWAGRVTGRKGGYLSRSAVAPRGSETPAAVGERRREEGNLRVWEKEERETPPVHLPQCQLWSLLCPASPERVKEKGGGEAGGGEAPAESPL